MDIWSKLIFHRNVSKICLKLVESIKDLSRKKLKGNIFILNSAGKSLAYSLFRIFAGASCVLEAASLILAIDFCTSSWCMSGPYILWPVCFNIRSSDDVIMRPLRFLLSHFQQHFPVLGYRVCLYNMNIPENLSF